MGRKKQMVKRMMENIKIMKRELSVEEKKKMEEQKQQVSAEEHQRRLKMLKEMGVLK